MCVLYFSFSNLVSVKFYINAKARYANTNNSFTCKVIDCYYSVSKQYSVTNSYVAPAWRVGMGGWSLMGQVIRCIANSVNVTPIGNTPIPANTNSRQCEKQGKHSDARTL